ncbi:hypothetical protein [Cellulosimicrobium marinum]|uniref:hypothetical protein n=1 Tax=Cellulosimicrobium marinum TaxID=1638992 RepID=UPI001E42E926|nr:hypothetical protein [Cellulosimicrobium marinum]MCB7138090.1 hypothetical protein [Cellulosimicrobium marinum]
MTTPAPRDDVLPLGPAPRPATGPELAARVRGAVVDAVLDADAGATGLDRVTVDAALEGADVVALDVALTGLAVHVARGETDDRPAPDATAPGAPAPGTRTEDAWTASDGDRHEPGTVRRLQVDAHPLLVEDVPVDLTAHAEGLRFTWVETDDGRLGVLPVEPDAAHPVTGDVRVAVPQDAVVEAARRLVGAELAAVGATLVSLDVTITSRGPRAVAVQAFARVRKGLLSASVHASLVADVDHRMVLTVREVGLTSRNPVIAALLVVARRHVDALRGRTVDLAAELPPGVRLGDVHLDVGGTGTVTLTARFV